MALILVATAVLTACGGGADAGPERASTANARTTGTAGPATPSSPAGTSATRTSAPRTSAPGASAHATPSRTAVDRSRAADGPITGARTAEPITIAFAGDIHFQKQVRALLDDPDTSLASLRPELASADLAIANLETSVTTRGAPEQKDFTFRAPATAFEAVAAAGVDVVTMANNHGVDYGPQGLHDTLSAAAHAPLAVVGIGADADAAFAPYVATIRGTRVAVIGADDVSDPTTAHFSAGPGKAGVASALDPTRLIAAVRAARRTADVVVVYLHWGTELVGCPTDAQRELAHKLAAAGADVVAGTHAHVQLGAGKLDGYDTFVAYGLGNFVWYNRSSQRTITTGVLTISLRGRKVTSARWAPATVQADGIPAFATGERRQEMRRDWADLRSCTDLHGVPEPPV